MKNKWLYIVLLLLLIVVCVGCNLIPGGNNENIYRMINLDSINIMTFNLSDDYFVCDEKGKTAEDYENDEKNPDFENPFGTQYNNKELTRVFRYFRKESNPAYVIEVVSGEFRMGDKEDAIESLKIDGCDYYIFEVDDFISGQKKYVVEMSECDEVYIDFKIDTFVYDKKEYDDWDIKEIKKVLNELNAQFL